MTELIAKPVLKDKFWIVEYNGSQIATIQAIENGGFVYVQNEQRQQFNTIKLLKKTHNVIFDKTKRVKSHSKPFGLLYEFPITGKAYNVMWDLRHKFPVFTKTSKSKSFFCAGYYIVYFNEEWTQMFCPKLITINRYKFRGPYKIKEDMINDFESLTNGK